MHESKGEQWTCAGKGERDATKHQNKDHNEEEPPPVAANLIGGCGLVLGQSTVTAAAGSRDAQAQPGLFPARCVSPGST